MASAPRDIITCISAPNADWTRYFNDTTVSLTTDWHTYSYEFEMTSQDDPSGRLEFNMGHLGSDATVYITYVSVKKISD